MSHKSIIIAILVLFALSFVSLAFIESRAKDPNLNKDWWTLSFQDPHGSRLDFTIENHSNTDTFTYEVTQDMNITTKKSVSIPKGDSKNITVSQASSDVKTTVTAWTDTKDKKEIYK
jgi:hypothetical protein